MGTESKKRRGLALKHPGSPKVIEMPPDLGERLIAHCEKGMSIRSFCFTVRISYETLLEFRKTNPEFANQYEMAKLALHHHCETQLNQLIDSERDPRVGSMLKFKLQNLAGWSERTENKSKQTVKQEVTHKIDTSKLSDKELEEQIKKLEE